jgi:hypothetical protein
VLKEVQMTPLALLGVVRLATTRAALRAGERAATTKVDPDLEPRVLGAEKERHDEPTLAQKEGEGEKLVLIHGGWSPNDEITTVRETPVTPSVVPRPKAPLSVHTCS